ncbi:MAG: hypothetical protein D5S03_03675 [Desulfonatronospira sp. MSAO_Bac3]|nr:MAG: hypothetical protein D5S03_03675 [Desulfonatronospira sp. MSAO_Bac3]
MGYVPAKDKTVIIVTGILYFFRIVLAGLRDLARNLRTLAKKNGPSKLIFSLSSMTWLYSGWRSQMSQFFRFLAIKSRRSEEIHHH